MNDLLVLLATGCAAAPLLLHPGAVEAAAPLAVAAIGTWATRRGRITAQALHDAVAQIDRLQAGAVPRRLARQAEYARADTLTIMLTGMGDDGARGMNLPLPARLPALQTPWSTSRPHGASPRSVSAPAVW